MIEWQLPCMSYVIMLQICLAHINKSKHTKCTIQDIHPKRILTHFPLDKMAAGLADDIFKCIFLKENDMIPIQISMKFVPKSSIDNKPALVQVMAWRRIGDKPYLNQWWPSSLTHICGTCVCVRLNSNLLACRSSTTSDSVAQSFSNFVQNTAVSAPCVVQNVKMIELLNNKLWAKEI